MMEFGVMIFLAFVATLGTLGNLCIIGACCLSKRLQVRSHAFIVNLAIADIIITSYIMPTGLISSQHETNPFGDPMCSINAFLIMTTCGVSTQSLMMIALERYFHICKTKYYRKIYTPKLVGVYIVFTWLYTSAWTCQGWTGWTEYIYGRTIYVCLFNGPVSVSYDICLVLFGMLLPMVVLIFAYVNIFRTVSRSKANLKLHRQKYRSSISEGASLTKSENDVREFRFVVTLLVIVIVFVIVWIPASVVLSLSGIWGDMPDLFYTVAVWLAFCNSGMNSIIYGLLNKNFRRGYLKLAQFLFCCRGKKCCSRAAGNHEDSVSTSHGHVTRNPETPISNSTTENSTHKPNPRPRTARNSHQRSNADIIPINNALRTDLYDAVPVDSQSQTSLRHALTPLEGLPECHSQTSINHAKPSIQKSTDCQSQTSLRHALVPLNSLSDNYAVGNAVPPLDPEDKCRDCITTPTNVITHIDSNGTPVYETKF